MLVFGMYKALPSLSTMTSENVIESWVQFTVVLKNKNLEHHKMLISTNVSHLIQIIIQIFSSENFGDSNQLIVVVMTVEKWLFAEDH